MAMTTYDGAQVTYSYPIGDWDTSIDYYYGNSKFDAVSNDNEDKTTLSGREDSEFEYDALNGIVLSASYDWINLRATYAEAQFKARAVIPVVGPTKMTLMDEFVDFYGVALFLTPGNWTLAAEYTEFEFDDYVNGEENWYLTAGYRFDTLLPHITYTHSECKDNIFDGDDLDNITVGLRWDFHSSAAIKFEYSKNDIEAGAGSSDSDAELLAMSIDLFF
jgi:predicted porin